MRGVTAGVLALAAALILGGPRSSAQAPTPPEATPAAPPARAELAPGVTLEVTELRRLSDKGVMQLRFTVANTSGDDTSLKDLGLAWNHSLKDIPVIDFAAKRQYNVGQAASCLCSTFRDNDGGVIRAGQKREFWAWYGLPPAGAKQMAIQLPDQPPLTNIPLL
jgi:hypothetical protein